MLLKGILFIAVIGCFYLCFCLAFGGHPGIGDLRAKAERTGRLEKLEKVTRFMILSRALIIILMVGLLAAIVFWIISVNGKQDVDMDWIRQYGLILVAGLLAALAGLILMIRLLIRRKMLELEEPVPEAFEITSMHNPVRFDRYMTLVILLVVVIIVCMLLLRNPYLNKIIVLAVAAVFMGLLVLCFRGAVRESRDQPVMAVISREGIRRCPEATIPWESIEEAEVHGQDIILTFRKEVSKSKRRLNLKGCHYSESTLRYMISCFSVHDHPRVK